MGTNGYMWTFDGFVVLTSVNAELYNSPTTKIAATLPPSGNDNIAINARVYILKRFCVCNRQKVDLYLLKSGLSRNRNSSKRLQYQKYTRGSFHEKI